MNEKLQLIINTLSTQGHQQYGGEAVTQLEHALECANLAEKANAKDELIVACLFHDLGHLISDGKTSFHEYCALEILQVLFPPAITEPIRLHVEAKRYLCAIEPNYYNTLSPASKQSLEVQGGVFSLEAANSFINQIYAEDAVQLRRWDEQSKVPHLPTPPLPHFLTVVTKV